MRAILVPAAFAAILSTSAIALAAAQHTAGTVKTFDQKAMTLTLSDGSVYMLPKGYKNPGLKAGEKVSINWEQKNGHKVADQITVTN
jgi:Cu/Ag efflux protein CusF